MDPRGKRALALAIAVVLVTASPLYLAACGGGGGGNGAVDVQPPPPPIPPPPPTPPPASAAPVDGILTGVHADQAHAAGFTGKGQIIAIVGTGIWADNPTVQGRVIASQSYIDCTTVDCNDPELQGHGTGVAETAAGGPFAGWPGGIAPDASLVSGQLGCGTGAGANFPAGPTCSIEGGTPTDIAAAAALVAKMNAFVAGTGARIMNNSTYWGFSATDNPATDAGLFAAAYLPFVTKDNGLAVFAAGNDGAANPSDYASMPYWVPALEQGWLVGVAEAAPNATALASYSDACGRAMDYCLTVPIDGMEPAPYPGFQGLPDTSLIAIYGTSNAAPQISGVAALVWQAFPYFTNDLVRQTLLGTADPLGGSQPNPTFGYGQLDAARAVKGPMEFNWGNVSVSFDGITSTWSNDITGTGGLIKGGSGTLILAGNDSYAGGTTISAGTLQAAHVLPGAADVRSGGTLDAVPGVEGTLTNAGTVTVAGGNTAIGGDFAQAASGTLSVSLGSVLAVTGKASLAGTFNLLGADAGYVAGSHQAVLTATGGVTGTFARMTAAPGVLLGSATLNYGTQDVWLDATQVSVPAAAAAADAARSAMVAAERVQAGFESIDVALATRQPVAAGTLAAAAAIQHTSTNAALDASLQSLSGQLYAARTAVLLDGMDTASDALMQRLDALSAQRARPGPWLDTPDGQGSLQRFGYAGARFQSADTLAGDDMALGHHALVGYAVGTADGFGQLTEGWNREHDRASRADVYVAARRGSWYARAQLGAGWYRSDLQRVLVLGYAEVPVSSDSSGRFATGTLEGGIHWRGSDFAASPFVALRYQRLEQGAFAERGGLGFGLMANAHAVTRVRSGLGMRLDRGWRLADGMVARLAGEVAWWHAPDPRGDALDARFTGFDRWLPVDGVGLSRDEAVARMGLSLLPNQHLALQLDAEREAGGGLQSNTVALRMACAF